MRVVRRAAALTDVRFMVVEGVRTLERQREYFRLGKSRTMKSRHLLTPAGFGHAVDIVPYFDVDNDGDLDISWEWKHFRPLAATLKEAARLENVPIEWGGDWRTFKDGPHWQLPWAQYPG